MQSFTILILVSLALTAACNRGDRSSSATEALGDTVGEARHVAVIARSSTPYRSVTVQNPGRVTGSAQFSGTPRGDTLVIVPADQNGCGRPLAVQLLQRRGTRVAGAIVWLTDVREGRAIPIDRRFEIDNDNCAWNPIVQADVAGGAINVVNYDPLVDRAFITDVATGDTVAVAPFTDNGQVIPYDKFMRTPGIYEFSVESRPMSRAWVAVFDQPYFAVTDANGSFALDSVPPGTHHVRAWHPMLGVADGTVTVPASGSATVDLTFH